MTHLILHIGPPKCGSSSIQHFLKSEWKGHYRHVSPPLIDLMDQNVVSDDSNLAEFISEVNEMLKKKNFAILSHEYFFECHRAVKFICDQVKADRISIIGYVRPSSKLLVAAFNQWEFRNPEMSDSINEILKSNLLEPNLFLGTEAYLMAIVLDSQKLTLKPYKWSEEFLKLESLISHDHVELIVNSLPSKNRSFDLIEDFCDKSGLAKGSYSPDVINPAFSEIIVESFYRTSKEFKNRLGQHGYNHFLRKVSAEMNEVHLTTSSLFQKLCAYIDGETHSETISFSRRYNIPEEELLPDNRTEKDAVLKLIKEENNLRQSQSSLLVAYQNMSSEWAVRSFDDFVANSKKKSSKSGISKLLTIFKKK